MLVERMLHNTGKREGKVMSCQHFHMESAINQSSNRLEIRSNLANCSRQHTTTAKRVYCICDRSFCSIRFDEMSVKRRDTNAHVSCGGTRWEDFIFTASSESLTQIAKHRPSSIVQWTNTSFVRNSRLSWRGAGVDYSQPQGRGGEQWKQRRQVAQGVKLTLIERKTIRGGIRGEPPQAARLPWVQFHFRLPRGKYFHEGWKRMLIGRMANMIKRDYSNM